MDTTEKRTEKRTPFSAAVDYTYAYSEDDKLKCQTSVGITTNLSKCGLGFYTYAPIAQGQAITLFSRQLSTKPVGAEARWCSRISENVFKVGLKFTRSLEVKAARTEEIKKEEPAREKPAVSEDWKSVISSIREQVEALEAKLGDEVEGLLAVNKRLQSLSVTDDLTGIYNRRYFYDRLEAERNLLDRYGHTLSVMILDIDNFKFINDRYGHVAGDALLKEFAEVVKKGLRRGDVFARYGGEEFAAILPHTSGRAALAAAENIRKTVEATSFISIEGKSTITVSIGVTEIGREIRDPQEVVKRADRALYEAKIRGKNTVLLWPKKRGHIGQI